ncbi:MAG: hypothetical protein ACLQBX_00385 [Candidatus Limnocylindrales bacterium]
MQAPAGAVPPPSPLSQSAHKTKEHTTPEPIAPPGSFSCWEEDRAGPDEVFTLRSEVVAVDGDIAVVRVVVQYREPLRQKYTDLWIVRLDDQGRCLSFEEWPYWPGAVVDQGGVTTAAVGDARTAVHMQAAQHRCRPRPP